MELKTLEQFLEDVNPLLEKGQVDIRWGKYEGKDFVIFESMNNVEEVEAFLQGFSGLKYGTPYIREDESLDDRIEAAKKDVESNPDHYGYKRELERLTTYLLYKQYTSTVEGHLPVLEDYDFEFGFDDEYSFCVNCNAILRTSPDCYQWVAPLWVECEGWACDDCVAKGDFDDYILEEYCDKNKALPEAIDLDRLGLVKINKENLQNGFFEGMSDDPNKVIKALSAHDIRVWFKVFPSQFYVEFDCYVRAGNKNTAIAILERTNTYQGFSTVDRLKKSLGQI